MTNELTELQARYLAGVETMNKEDARRFLTLLEADYGAEYRESRMNTLTRRLRTIERIGDAEQREKDKYEALNAAARKYREITDRWEAQGAVSTVVQDGYAVEWTRKGERLLLVYGGLTGLGKHIDEVLADVQRIDVEFQELLRKGAME